MKCLKLTYETEAEVKEYLLNIILSDWKPWKKSYKPTRYYKCEKCHKYHLTSQIKITRYKR